MKKSLAIFCLFFVFVQTKAQDIIVKNDKTEIKAKIEELTETSIKYKKIEMLDGPSYNINKRDVFMIIYKNGTKEYMETTASQPMVESSKDIQQQNSTPNKLIQSPKIDEYTGKTISHEKLILDGKYIYFEGKQVKYKESTKILVTRGSTEVQELINSMVTLKVGSNVAGIVSSIGLGSSLKSTKVTNSGLFLGSAVVFGGAVYMGILSLNKYRKAIRVFNQEGYDPKVGLRTNFEIMPLFAADKNGNHIGIAIRF